MQLAKAAIRADKVCTGARLQKGPRRTGREFIGSAGADHAVTVESGKPFGRAKPDEPAGIGDDAIDAVGGQPV
jgi:hypothetical protein